MKRTLSGFLLCTLLLAGCASRTPPVADTSLPGAQLPLPESVQNSSSLAGGGSPSPTTPPAGRLDYTDIFSGISLQLLDDFASPQDISPDGYVTFFFLANYGEGKMPIPEGFRQEDGQMLLFPADMLERFITGYFAVDAEYLRRAQSFTGQGYELPGLGLAPQVGMEIVQVDESDPRNVQVTFRVLINLPGEDGQAQPMELRRVASVDITNGLKLNSLRTL